MRIFSFYIFLFPVHFFCLFLFFCLAPSFIIVFYRIVQLRLTGDASAFVGGKTEIAGSFLDPAHGHPMALTQSAIRAFAGYNGGHEHLCLHSRNIKMNIHGCAIVETQKRYFSYFHRRINHRYLKCKYKLHFVAPDRNSRKMKPKHHGTQRIMNSSSAIYRRSASFYFYRITECLKSKTRGNGRWKSKSESAVLVLYGATYFFRRVSIGRPVKLTITERSPSKSESGEIPLSRRDKGTGETGERCV